VVIMDLKPGLYFCRLSLGLKMFYGRFVKS
jgi:hypothetical protein